MTKTTINPQQNFINTNTFSPKGRIGRQRFLATSALLLLALVIISGVFAFTHVVLYPYEPSIPEAYQIILGLTFEIIWAFSHIKRCRDAGISPHWTWCMLVLPTHLILFLFLAFKESIPEQDSF